MAVYLTIFWLLLILFLIVYAFFKTKTTSRLINNYGGLFFLGLIALLFMAFATKDPINIPIPTEVQWLSSLLVAIAGLWKFYLSPIQNKVFSLNREVGEIRSDLSSIKSDLSLIMQELVGHRVAKRRN